MTAMPIFEFYCPECKRKMSFLVMSAAPFHPACRFCGSGRIEQLYSRFAMPKSEESRLESLADPSSLSGLDEKDPGSVARWMKKMGKELGEEFAGEDIDQIADEAAREAAGEGGTEDQGGGSAEDL